MKIFTTTTCAAQLVSALLETPSQSEVQSSDPIESMGRVKRVSSRAKEAVDDMRGFATSFVISCEPPLTYYRERKPRKMSKADKKRGFHLNK